VRVDDDCKHFRVRCKPRQVSNERRSNTTGMDPIAMASNVALRVKQSLIGCSENVARSMSGVWSEMLNLTFFFVAVMLANSHSNGVVAPGTALPRRRVAGLRAGNQARIRGGIWQRVSCAVPTCMRRAGHEACRKPPPWVTPFSALRTIR